MYPRTTADVNAGPQQRLLQHSRHWLYPRRSRPSIRHRPSLLQSPPRRERRPKIPLRLRQRKLLRLSRRRREESNEHRRPRQCRVNQHAKIHPVQRSRTFSPLSPPIPARSRGLLPPFAGPCVEDLHAVLDHSRTSRRLLLETTPVPGSFGRPFAIYDVQPS